MKVFYLFLKDHCFDQLFSYSLFYDKLLGRYKRKMSLDQTVCEDLKAFERRLTEVISSLQPATLRWRILLGFISICTAVGAWHWLSDPNTSAVSFTQSLYNHPFFAVASIILVILFMLGVHRRVIAPSIITQRARSVLGDFNMSCDDTGKLILKPTRPPHPHET